MEFGEDLEVGVTKLVVLPKPGKPADPVKNLRPITLLPLLRKVLPFIIQKRTRSAFEFYFSPAQSGFRQGRSCCDIIWAHRWLIAKIHRFKIIIHILGLDMSRAFDTIDRAKLLEILNSVADIHDDDIRLIRVLLADTVIHVHFNGISTKPFTSNIGSPQGDGLSPVLFPI